MAIQNLYPAIRPSLDLNFAGSKTVDPRITFTRESSATYFDEFGVMRTASNNVPRIDHSPLTGECLGLLIEEQRTNLLTYSEQFDNAAWNKFQATVTQNAVIAPDGTFAADKLIESAAAGQHYITQTVSVPSNTSYAPSVFVKAAERTKCRVVVGGTDWSSEAAADIDLTNGTLLYSAGTVSVVPAGNGWYRVSIVGVTGSTTAFRGLLVLPLDNANNTSYTGDGTSGIYIWGAQLEVGAFPTSYIKTEASQVTRSVDRANMTGANFSSWFRQDEGSFCAEFSVNALRQAMIFSSGLRGIGTQPNGSIQVGLYDSGDGAIFQAIVTTVGKPYKVALVHDSKEIGGYGYSGSFASGKSSNYIVPTNTSLVLGSQDTKRWLNGHIRKIAYYPRRLTNTQLQALTT